MAGRRAVVVKDKDVERGKQGNRQECPVRSVGNRQEEALRQGGMQATMQLSV